MITIQPTTDVILLGSVLNWKKKQRSSYPYSNYLVYETILIVKISYFFSVYRNGIQNWIGYVIVNDIQEELYEKKTYWCSVVAS